MMVCLLFVKTSELDMIVVYLMCDTKMMVGFFLMHNYFTFVLNNETLGLI